MSREDAFRLADELLSQIRHLTQISKTTLRQLHEGAYSQTSERKEPEKTSPPPPENR